MPGTKRISFLSFFFYSFWSHISQVKLLFMAQMQLDMATHFAEEFGAVQWDGSQVTCRLNQRFSLIVKRCKQSIYILLRSGNKVIRLPFTVSDKVKVLFRKKTFFPLALEIRSVASNVESKNEERTTSYPMKWVCARNIVQSHL